MSEAHYKRRPLTDGRRDGLTHYKVTWVQGETFMSTIGGATPAAPNDAFDLLSLAYLRERRANC